MQIGSKSILTQAIFFELPGILQVSDSLVQFQMKMVQLFAFGARYRNFNILFKFNSSELLLDIQYRRKIKKCTFLQNDSKLKLIFLSARAIFIDTPSGFVTNSKLSIVTTGIAGGEFSQLGSPILIYHPQTQMLSSQSCSIVPL